MGTDSMLESQVAIRGTAAVQADASSCHSLGNSSWQLFKRLN